MVVSEDCIIAGLAFEFILLEQDENRADTTDRSRAAFFVSSD
jgi:hypothetical protein